MFYMKRHSKLSLQRRLVRLVVILNACVVCRSACGNENKEVSKRAREGAGCWGCARARACVCACVCGGAGGREGSKQAVDFR
jgi:hypothetical protein